MKYKFESYMDESFYSSSCIVFICGTHAVFNSLVIDKCRHICKADLELDSNNSVLSVLGEFGDGLSESSTSLDFGEFMDYVKTPSVYGKWFCSVNYKMLSSKQRERLWNYIKKPSENGLLVITVNDFKDYRVIGDNKTIKKSAVANMISLDFPNSAIKHNIVAQLFQDKGIEVEEKALSYFIMRLGDAYDDYTSTIDTILISLDGETKLKLDRMKQLLKGTENYMLNDLILALTKPVSSDKIRSRKIYRILASLLSDGESWKIVNRLIREIDIIIQFRIAINKGQIPVLVRYSANEAKREIGEDNPICKYSNIRFKRLAYLASRATLKDWYFMKLILMNRPDANNYSKDSEIKQLENLKVLIALVHRGVIPNDRLMNDIGVKDTLKEGLYELNSLYWRKDYGK